MPQNILFIFLSILFPVISFSRLRLVNITGNATFNRLLYNVSEAGEEFVSSLENESDLCLDIKYSNIGDKWLNPNRK
ncbi:hypothetical protein [Maribellus maritimus]|uniref:hypothetical protein n=1 Tax=Maribellus maritimus TaxID=2870838 RepID=UPI001EE9FBA0|nr:hypothetical protein [Maribellus maritimus]MCG6189031.1 hypothetical protein [Maribellus maritimus]